MPKAKVLTFVTYYLPGHKSGGPVRSTSNIVKALGDELDFFIVTSDRDVGDRSPFDGVKVDDWNKVENGEVFYAAPGSLSLRECRRQFEALRPDIVYFNSLFDPRFTLKPLVALRLSNHQPRRILVAPRGELSPGALGFGKVKKKIFLGIARAIGFYKQVTFHASSEYEANDIRNIFGTSAIEVARNIVSINNAIKHISANNHSNFRVVFLSRISPKKNLKFALEALSLCKSSIEFNIYGPVSDVAYWQMCNSIIEELPKNIKAHYRGVVPPVDIPSIMGKHDLFLLPTLGENFGHVILEALLSGTPVLISDRTPWRNLSCKNVGWDLSLEEGPSSFAQAIDTYAAKSVNVRAQARGSVAARAIKMSGHEEAIEAHRRMLVLT